MATPPTPDRLAEGRQHLSHHRLRPQPRCRAAGQLFVCPQPSRTSSHTPCTPVTITPHAADPQCPRLVHRPAAGAAGRMGAGGGRISAATAAGVAGVPAGDADPDRADECLR